jgi:O-antigen/teichoic acid export membrane protein
MALGQGGGFLLQSVYFILIARLLGPSEYGLYAGAFALTSILGQYSAMGSGTLFLRYVTADRKQFSVYWGNILVTTTVISILIVAGLAVFSGTVLGPGARALTLLAAVANCFCFQLTASAARVFQTFEELRITAGLTLANNFARMLAAAIMLCALHRANAYQWSIATVALSLLTASASVLVVTVRFGRPSFSLGQVRRNMPEGFGYSFASSTATAYNDIDKTMLSYYGMNAANGIYSMAYRIIDVATIPILAIREASMPRFFRSGLGGIRGAAPFAVVLLKRALPLGVLAAGAVFVTAPAVPRLAGSGFQETVSALRWLCLIPLFRSLHQMSGSAITGCGLQRYRTVSQMLAVGLNVGLNVWLIPRHGWLGRVVESGDRRHARDRQLCHAGGDVPVRWARRNHANHAKSAALVFQSSIFRFSLSPIHRVSAWQGAYLVGELSHNHRVARRGFQDRLNDRIPRLLKLFGAKFSKHERSLGDCAGDLLLRGGFVFAGTDQAESVEGASVQGRKRALIDKSRQRTKDDIDRDQKDGDKYRVEHLSRARACPNCRGTPQRGCGIQPPHVAAIFHDGARAEKSNSGNDVGNNLCGTRRHSGAQVDEGGRAETHQRICAQSRGALPPLTFGADQGAQQ